MAPTGSITELLPEFKAGDERATSDLWKRVFDQIVRQARRRLLTLGVPRRVEDEEDVALSVFRRLCDLAERGSLADLNRTEDLWCLLVTITAGKVTDLIRRHAAQKRGGGDVRGESALDGSGIQGFVGGTESPEMQAIFDEQIDRLLNILPDPTTRRVAEMYLQGGGKSQIARELGLSKGVVYRKLELILGLWKNEATRESS